MKKSLLGTVIFALFYTFSHAQVEQVLRYEMEKKNTDDFFAVEPAGELGVVIIRDTNKEFSFKDRVDGDTWEITALDTTFQEIWKHDLSLDFEFVFKAYDLYKGTLFLLFRDGQFEKNDYHLITINIPSGDIERYDIENEIALDLSHITVVDNVVVLGGYVRYSPTLVSYNIGSDKIEVVPGFFKDRSDIVDLKTNANGTFNVLTLEKAYNGYFIRLRTCSKSGTTLFEREIEMSDEHRILSGKSSGFVNGNIAVAGTYGARNSYYSQGAYFAIAKPGGQSIDINYIDFTEMEHFFDYMRPKRAERIKRKIKRKKEQGKDYNYNSRLLIHDIMPAKDGFLLTAEVYDPRYERTSRPEYNNYYGQTNRPYDGANFNYIRQPNRLVNVEDANHFEFLQSIVLKLDNNGKLTWDGSFPIEDVESASLEPIVDVAQSGDQILVAYKNEEQLSTKRFVSADSSIHEVMPIKLKYEYDEIQHNYDLIGGTEHWYGDNFFIWGYHKVENKENQDIDKRRAVLFINKVRF